MQSKRAALVGDKYLNGTQLAKRLGIGMTTLSRWVKAGKLPKPEKSISRMLLFDREAIGQLEGSSVLTCLSASPPGSRKVSRYVHVRSASLAARIRSQACHGSDTPRITDEPGKASRLKRINISAHSTARRSRRRPNVPAIL